MLPWEKYSSGGVITTVDTQAPWVKYQQPSVVQPWEKYQQPDVRTYGQQLQGVDLKQLAEGGFENPLEDRTVAEVIGGRVTQAESFDTPHGTLLDPEVGINKSEILLKPQPIQNKFQTAQEAHTELQDILSSYLNQTGTERFLSDESIPLSQRAVVARTLPAEQFASQANKIVTGATDELTRQSVSFATDPVNLGLMAVGLAPARLATPIVSKAAALAFGAPIVKEAVTGGAERLGTAVGNQDTKETTAAAIGELFNLAFGTAGTSHAFSDILSPTRSREITQMNSSPSRQVGEIKSPELGVSPTTELGFLGEKNLNRQTPPYEVKVEDKVQEPIVSVVEPLSQEIQQKEGGGLIVKEQLAEQEALKNEQSGAINLGVVRELLDEAKLGIKTLAKTDPQQLYNRLVNKGFKGELDATEGLQQFMQSGKKTPEEMAKFVEENGPKVEVKKFGESTATQAQKEFNNLSHSWYDNLPTETKIRVRQMLGGSINNSVAPEHVDIHFRDSKFIDNLNKFIKLNDDISSTGDRPNQSHWQSVAPKSEQDMPGYVEGAVVKGERDFVTEDDKFPVSHSFPPNTLGFFRGYMEHHPNGEKTFHVIEVQSDWAQTHRNRIQGVLERHGQEASNIVKEKEGDPLLKHYERLTLKAAIDHAREQGATRIAVSDAETAMMTEGHDRQVAHDVHGIEYATKEDLDEMIDQAKGMRLHYDRTLPKILEELTGSKGEKVEFGEHKNAVEASDDTRESLQGGYRNYTPRKDLIFRDTSGQPKTSITARSFPLDKARSDFGLMSTDKPIQSSNKNLTSQSGAISLAQIKQAFEDKRKDFQDDVNKFKKKLNVEITNRKLRSDTIPSLFDSASNRSSIEAKQTRNDVETTLRHDLKTPKVSEVQGRALGQVVEAKGDIKNLDVMQSKVQGVKTKEARQLVEAIEYSRSNWSKLQQAAKQFVETTKNQVNLENSNGIPTNFREGYVPHVQDLSDFNSVLFDRSSGGSGSDGSKQRIHDTFADSISANVKPVSLNALDLLEHRLKAGNQRIYTGKVIDNLKQINDPASGESILKDLITQKKKLPVGQPDQYETITPKGYEPTYFGNHPVAVQKNFEGLFNALNGKSAFEHSAVGRAALQVTSGAKHTALLFDLYHPIRLFAYAAPLRGVKALESTKPGLFTLDYNDATLKRMADNGEIPQSLLPEIKRRRNIANLAVGSGFNIGKINDALHTELIRKIPGIGTYNKWLFDKFQRGLMLETYVSEFDRLKAKQPNIPDSQIARKLSMDLNSRFGNLMNQSWIKSKTFKDALRLFFLAPQWNEGLIRSEVGAGKQAGQFLLDTASGKRAAAGTLFKDAGSIFAAYFIANQFINYLSRGIPTWKNPEDGIGAKMSAFVPDKLGSSQGFFLNPMSIAAEISHQVVNRMEKKKSTIDALTDVIGYKESSLGRSLQVILSGHDWRGQHLEDWDRIKEAVKEGAPVPIQAPAIYDALSGKESYPGEVQKSLMSSLGVKTDSIPPESEESKSIKKFGTNKPTLSQRAEISKDKEKYQTIEGLELKNSLSKEVKTQIDKRKLAVPGFVSTLGYAGGNVKLKSDELKFYKSKIVEHYETEFKEVLNDPEFNNLTKTEQQEVITHASERARKEARQELIDMIESR